MSQGGRFNPWSGHMQEATHECINKWYNKSMFLSLSLKSVIFFSSHFEVILFRIVTYLGHFKYDSIFKNTTPLPWPMACLAGASSGAPKGCGFHPWSQHVREATNWCFSLTLMFLFLSLSNRWTYSQVRIKKINLKNFLKNHQIWDFIV